jgi:hypothetical protein
VRISMLREKKQLCVLAFFVVSHGSCGHVCACGVEAEVHVSLLTGGSLHCAAASRLLLCCLSHVLHALNHPFGRHESGDGGSSEPLSRRLVAFVGGLDLTEGRYDTHDHPLFASTHPGGPHEHDLYQGCIGGTCGAVARRKGCKWLYPQGAAACCRPDRQPGMRVLQQLGAVSRQSVCPGGSAAAIFNLWLCCLFSTSHPQV